ncbi:MAG: class I SAM-dependent methyltransferase [Candidatus Aquilonibacter sp.]
MTRYLDRVMAGERPTATEWDDHLVAFHRVYTGLTPDLMSHMRQPDGRSSYEVLAHRIKTLAPNAHDILDVGCGDGTLLRELARMYGPNIALTGIDLSDDEIAGARALSPGAQFVRGGASTVNLGQKSYDVAVSHLAFMAMSEIRTVLAHVHDGLRGAGMLIFVCEDPLAGGAIFELIGDAIAFVRGRLGSFSPNVPGRESIDQDEVLCEMLRGAGFATAWVEHFCLHGKLTEDQLWAFIEQSYPLGLLDSAVRGALRDAMRSRLRAIVRSGAITDFPLRLVVASV